MTGNWRLGRRPALDGLRGVAVLLVVATHFDDGQVTLGGVMGVKMFFTLSGFLITTLLLEERARTSRVSIPAFYARRARRLLPALAVVLLVFGALSLAGLPLDITGGMVAAIVAYCSNWYLLATASGGAVHWGALGHTWSLAIEEQFYLIWPPLVIVAMRWRRGVLTLAGVLAVGSLAWWGGTRSALDTSVSAWCLLAGCILAALMHGARVRDVPSWPALGVLACIPFAFTSAGNLAHMATPLLTVAAIWVAVQRRVWWLELGWLRWVGVRSYGLYLWHVPVAYLCGRAAGPWWAVSIVGVVVSFGLCAASWRWLESPWLRSRLDADLRRLPVDDLGVVGRADDGDRAPQRQLR